MTTGGIETEVALHPHHRESNHAGARSYRLEISVGIARAMPSDNESIHALVEIADEAMYKEKRLPEGAA